jgi:FKBP-type peptidyl-prolyl cis-trans isomerase 2
MRRAEHGSTVSISYIGTLDNGRIFDNTEESGPMTFTIGNNQVFAALEEAVIGMAIGEVKNIVISAAEAYGPRSDANLLKVKREQFPAGREPRIGEKLRLEFSAGKERVMMVIDVGEHEVLLDGNHPLAGCDLTFALRLDAIE